MPFSLESEHMKLMTSLITGINLSLALSAAWPVLHIALQCPPPPAEFICLILLQSLLLNFPRATLATPIAIACLFLNVHCAFLQLVEEALIE